MMGIRKFIKYMMVLFGAAILVYALATAIERGYVSYQTVGIILLSLAVFSFLKWKKTLRLDEMYVPIQFITD
jgi:hypothetical protein